MRQGRAALHSDHLLTARAATDANQKLIWRWHSDAFGVGEAESLTSASHPEAQSLTLNLRFPGQYHDQESGLYYNYFRTYDPSKGRYTQSDPIGLLGGVNTFGYVYSSPIGYSDPLGLEVLMQIHPVVAFTELHGNIVTSINHAKITIIPMDQQKWSTDSRFSNILPDGRVYLTIGAGPEGGKLTSGLDRDRDINLGHNVGSVSVIGDACPTIWGENSLIEELLLAESNFRKSTPLDYEFFPQSFTNGYNSNSFIAGLLNHVGLPAATPNNVPGFDKPVPIEHFR